MPIRQIFMERFSLLLSAYSVNYPQTAQVLGAKNKTSVYNWVKGRNFPNETMLVAISRLFAVSLDWLLGNISTPYRLDFLEELEEEAIPYIAGALQQAGQSAPAAYLDKIERIAAYSPGVRADLIFCALYTKYLAKNYWEFNSAKILKEDPLATREQWEQNDQEAFGLRLLSDGNSIGEMLFMKRKTPLHDLSAAIKNA